MKKIDLPVLETERLILRPLTIDDLQAIFKWAGDSRVNKYMIYPLYKNPEDGREWLESLYEDEKKLDYGFVLKSTGELIGSGGLYYHQDIDVWSIGYNIAYDHWHNGYTPEAIKLILEYAQEKYGVKVLTGTFALDNIDSRRVMEKLGMTFYEDTEYSKLDGSQTFKAKTYRRVFV